MIIAGKLMVLLYIGFVAFGVFGGWVSQLLKTVPEKRTEPLYKRMREVI